ncbi:MAG: DUF1428 family protein [Alphaproteobacteria bacterium]
MAYIVGFVVAVPAENKEAYKKHAAHFLPMLKEFGVARMVETWADDVPDGKVTDFRGAVKAKPGEAIVFSWFEYPSKQVRDEAGEKMMADPRMENMGANAPFDAQRMIYGGFAPLVDEGAGGKMGYVDATLIAVPTDAKDAFGKFANDMAALFNEYGATRVVDAWGDDVPDGKITDFKGAVKAEANEKVVYCWVEWPSKDVRDKAWKRMESEPRMQAMKMPFDGKRMVFGGFAPILDA